MIISLVDADMLKYHQTPFNIDIMKLSTYYKRKKEIVKLTPFIAPDRFSKIIYRKDYDDGDYPSQLLMNSKVEYGGRAFNRNKYVPLPLEVENCLCDRYIYESMRQIFCTNKINTTLFNQMSRAQHLRLSKDGIHPRDNWTQQLDDNGYLRTFIFHDYDLGLIDGAIDMIKEINTLPGQQTRFIGMKYPVQTYNLNQLLEWTQFKPMALFYNLQYNGLMTDECLYEFITRQRGTSIAAQTTYNITYDCKTQDDMLVKLPQLYRQIVFLRSNRCKLRLIYDDTIFSDKRWCRLLDLFIHYHKQVWDMSKADFERIVPFDSLHSLVANFSDKETYHFHFKETENKLMLIDEARDLFRLVKDTNYDLFKDFYECHQVELKGGIFQYV